MNKRANRVYWLLLIMMLILGLSMAVDGIRAEKHKNDQPQGEAVENATEITTTETVSETTSISEEDTSEITTLSSEDAKKKLTEFYSGQVFMGDSIMSGYASYTFNSDAPEWLNNVIFLTKVSWGISSALNDNNGPLYHGKAQNVTASLAEIKPKRIFMNLGINEMNGLGSPGYSVEKLIGKYGELIEGIKAAVPDSKLYIINVTPCTEEKETAIFNNEIIKKFNDALKENSKTWGVTYLDLAGEFGDVLDSELSTDGIHHNNKSYSEKWVPFFEKFALSEN